MAAKCREPDLITGRRDLAREFAGSPEAAEPLDSLIRRTEGLQPWRRLFHVVGGITIAGVVSWVGPESTVARALLGAAAVLALSMDVVRLRVEKANRLFFRWFRRLASPREAEGIASSTWYLLGAFLVLLLAPPQVFLPVMLVLAFADPAASVVGRLWGRRTLGKGTWEGTAVFYLVASAVLVPAVGLPLAAAAAAVVAASEVMPLGLDDNLVIPVVAAATLWVLGVPT